MTSLTLALRFVRRKPQAFFAPSTTAQSRPFSLMNDGQYHGQSNRLLLTSPPHRSLYALLQRSHPHHSSCGRCFSSKDEKEQDENPNELTPSEDPSQEIQVPGAQAGGKKLAIVYTCKVCNTRSIKQFSEHSYQNGVVLVRCPGCQNLHLIADRLGIIDGDGDWDIEKAMAKLGENVNVVNNDNVLEMSLEDLVGGQVVVEESSSDATTTSGKEDEEKKS